MSKAVTETTNRVDPAQLMDGVTMSSTTATTATITLTSISKYRALFLVLASEQGWKYQQVSTHVDAYSKGTEVVVLSWGTSQLKGFSHTKGKAQVASAEGGVANKLQKAQKAMGGEDLGSKKWPKLSQKKVEELEALALATFKVIQPKG